MFSCHACPGNTLPPLRHRSRLSGVPACHPAVPCCTVSYLAVPRRMQVRLRDEPHGPAAVGPQLGTTHEAGRHAGDSGVPGQPGRRPQRGPAIPRVPGAIPDPSGANGWVSGGSPWSEGRGGPLGAVRCSRCRMLPAARWAPMVRRGGQRRMQLWPMAGPPNRPRHAVWWWAWA
jgi:hypothetical protein